MLKVMVQFLERLDLLHADFGRGSDLELNVAVVATGPVLHRDLDYVRHRCLFEPRTLHLGRRFGL